MQMPPPIRTYFTARAPQDGDALAAAFPAAPTSFTLDSAYADGRTFVRATVTGDFPGSPAMLRFAFALSDDRITALEIGA